MRRRSLVALLLASPLAWAQQQQQQPLPRHKVGAAQLHESLSKRFPLRKSLGNVLQLEVSAPGLLLHPARNKLGASVLLEASGPALQRVEQGQLDVVFALRYEASDRSLRAWQPEIVDVRLPGATPELAQVLQGLLPRVSRDVVGELVLHRFTDRELALPDTMGFEPGKLTVVEDGLVVEFVPKARS